LNSLATTVYFMVRLTGCVSGRNRTRNIEKQSRNVVVAASGSDTSHSQVIDIVMRTFHNHPLETSTRRGFTMERTHDVRTDDRSLIELESWIEAARQGDREALGQALSAVRDYLLLVANKELDPSLRCKGNASDLVQETFLRAQRGMQAFRGRTPSEWRHWLRSILVRNLAQERRRFCSTAKRQIRLEVNIADERRFEGSRDNETPSRNLALRELEQALIEGLSRLPVHYREVVIWHQREQLSFEEIGRRRQISAEAARKLWTRALGRLRKELGPAHEAR
jgi:RNA polymerase sigma-70 factor, ECF subfamily